MRGGLPEWSVNVLDALLASRVVRADQLDGLASLALQEVASEYVRASASGVPFNAEKTISTARNRSADERYNRRRAAA
jgi:hypothetical protein